MEYEIHDVEKDFPGLYAAEGADTKSKRSKDSSDFSEGEHEKVTKTELLIGKRKDKGKDCGYAALAGESSSEDNGTKSPTKTKKSKAFKFTSSRSKEKRDKSEHEDKMKEREKPEKKKDKDRKDKTKDKEKRDKKAKQSRTVSEEVLKLGDCQPVFGVSISLATERSRCHDGINLPLIVRDCIDYLQQHELQNEDIYKVEPDQTRLQHFKRLYNNRERQPDTDVLDMATSCGLLKLFLRELPESILTTDLISRFDEVAGYAEVTKQEEELEQLLQLLPSCNKTLLSWIILHFDAVIQNEKRNKINAQSLALLLSPAMQTSQRLLVVLLCHCPSIFAHVKLIKYVPPITASSLNLPETVGAIEIELRKQESLLTQIHYEMNAGFVSKKREEQLWEVQRFITQLKRNLRGARSQHGTSVYEIKTEQKDTKSINIQTQESKHICEISNKCQYNSPIKTALKTQCTFQIVTEPMLPQMNTKESVHMIQKFDMDRYLTLSDSDYNSVMRLQLENYELKTWKAELKQRIIEQQAEMLLLKRSYQHEAAHLKHPIPNRLNDLHTMNDEDVEKDHVIDNYVRENTLLEYKRNMLAKQIFDEKLECITLQTELQLHKK